ncbi:MAG TPA: hypothetical protein VEA81_03220 [Burkholderiaceae bacterium]|nr:hypothetical protein [Burkholderiaceae bacterium]
MFRESEKRLARRKEGCYSFWLCTTQREQRDDEQTGEPTGRRADRKAATIFNNQQPISVGVWAESPKCLGESLVFGPGLIEVQQTLARMIKESSCFGTEET